MESVSAVPPARPLAESSARSPSPSPVASSDSSTAGPIPMAPPLSAHGSSRLVGTRKVIQMSTCL